MKASDYILYLIMLVSIKSFLAWVRTFTDESKFPERSFEKWDYATWLYLLFIDLAVYLFMHLLNTYLLSASTVC